MCVNVQCFLVIMTIHNVDLTLSILYLLVVARCTGALIAQHNESTERGTQHTLRIATDSLQQYY